MGKLMVNDKVCRLITNGYSFDNVTNNRGTWSIQNYKEQVPKSSHNDGLDYAKS